MTEFDAAAPPPPGGQPMYPQYSPAAPAAQPGYPVPPPRYSSLSGLAVAIQILLAVQAILCGAAIWAAFDQGSLVERVRTSPESVTSAEANDSDDIAGAIGLAQILLYVATGVVWIVWLFRASRNTRQWDGRYKSWGTGWTIGAWFIPVFNLVGPTLVTRQIAQDSDEPDVSGRRWPQPAVTWWGVAWVVMVVVAGIDRVVNRSLAADDYATLDDIDTVLLWDIAAAATMLLAAAVVLVRSLTRRQNARIAAQFPLVRAA